MSATPTSAVAVLTSWNKEDLLARRASGNWGVSPERILGSEQEQFKILR